MDSKLKENKRTRKCAKCKEEQRAVACKVSLLLLFATVVCNCVCNKFSSTVATVSHFLTCTSVAGVCPFAVVVIRS